jgi:stage II sporulation protein AA (anti-sigma F factor antagonist)
MNLSVHVEVSNRDAVVVHPVGEVDYSSLDPLREALLDARVAGVRQIVVDLAEVTFLDSQGLAVILFAHQRQRSVGGNLVLRDPGADVRRLMHVTNLGPVIDVEQSSSQSPARSGSAV